MKEYIMEDEVKIIFLDIDGVLNNLKDAHENNPRCDRFAQDYRNWNPKAIARLDDICFYGRAQVVISSTWRKIYPDHNWWNEQFRLAGCEYVDVIDITGNSNNGFRGREIQEYLNANPEITRYVILDDESDFYPYQPRIYVDMWGGLTILHAMEAINYLRGETELSELYCMEERNPPSE